MNYDNPVVEGIFCNQVRTVADFDARNMCVFVCGCLYRLRRIEEKNSVPFYSFNLFSTFYNDHVLKKELSTNRLDNIIGSLPKNLIGQIVSLIWCQILIFQEVFECSLKAGIDRALYLVEAEIGSFSITCLFKNVDDGLCGLL